MPFPFALDGTRRDPVSILRVLAIGHHVRTKVWNLKREGEVRAMLKESGAVPGDRLCSSPPISKTILGGQKPSPAANTFSTWHRAFP